MEDEEIDFKIRKNEEMYELFYNGQVIAEFASSGKALAYWDEFKEMIIERWK